MIEALEGREEFRETRFYTGIITEIDPEDYPVDDRFIKVLPQHDTARVYRTMLECSDVILDAQIESTEVALENHWYLDGYDTNSIRMDEIDPVDRIRLVVGLPIHVHQYQVTSSYVGADSEPIKYRTTRKVLCIPDGAIALTESEIEQTKKAQVNVIVEEAEARYKEIKTEHDRQMAEIQPVYQGMQFRLLDRIDSLRNDSGREILATKPRVLRIDEMSEPLLFGATLIDHKSHHYAPYENGQGQLADSRGVPIGYTTPMSPNETINPPGYTTSDYKLLVIRGKDFQGGTIAYQGQTILIEINGQHWYSKPDEWRFIEAAGTGEDGPYVAQVVYDLFYPLDSNEVEQVIDTGVYNIPEGKKGFGLVLPVDQDLLSSVQAMFLKTSPS